MKSRVTLENSLNGFFSSAIGTSSFGVVMPGVPGAVAGNPAWPWMMSSGCASAPATAAEPDVKSMLFESRIVRKLTVSMPFDSAGMIGGVMCRSRPHEMFVNHLVCLTSDAPAFDPNRLCSSLISSFLMSDLQLFETCLSSGNATSVFSTFENVALRFGPLNGVVANCGQLGVRISATHDHLVDQDS